MINSFGKTDDFIKIINSLSKTDDFIKMINLLSKTGLGRSGHDRSQSFGPIWHGSGPEMNGILTKRHNDSASFLPEKLKNQVILTQNLNM